MSRQVRPRAGTRRGRRVLIVLVVAVLVLVLAAAGAIVALTQSIGDGISRIPDAFGDLPAGDRPATSGGTTFLLVGTDTRAAGATTGSDAPAGVDAGSRRSDVIMLATVAPEGTTGSVVSIPRDSWVEIPGRGMNKINAAYAFGGPSLLIRTVEGLTGVRVDHFGVIDFAGFRSLVDSVGGIDVTVARDTGTAGVELAAGPNHLDGAQALAYVRQRYDLPDGDIDRARRQQNALRALLTRVQQQASSNPLALYDLAQHVGDTVSIDDTLSNTGLASLALRYRDLRSSGIGFVTTPVAGQGREGGQSVVYLDRDGADELWGAVRDGSVARYLDANPAQALGDAPP